jgi:Tfp pilus assembly protein PilO
MTLTKEKKRTLILVIIMGFMVLAASYYFGFRWINEAREQTGRKEVTLTDTVEKMKKTIEDGKIADKKLEAIEAKLKPVSDQMPPEQAETWLARAMDTVATRHELKLKGSRLSDPDPVVIDEARAFKHFGIVGYAFSVQGTYFKLGEFLADLEGAHPLMVIENMNIVAGAGGATNIHEMSLKVDMVTTKE